MPDLPKQLPLGLEEPRRKDDYDFANRLTRFQLDVENYNINLQGLRQRAQVQWGAGALRAMAVAPAIDFELNMIPYPQYVELAIPPPPRQWRVQLDAAEVERRFRVVPPDDAPN